MAAKAAKKVQPVGDYLDTLIPVRAGERDLVGLKLIDRERIVVGDQPRRSFPPDEQAELAANIRELKERKDGIEGTGLLSPLLVVPHGDKYLLVAGERRFRATTPTATWIGVEELPCLVIQAKADTVLLLQLIENLQRRDIPPLEEAEGFQKLMTTQRLSYRDMAKLLGKEKGYVENRLQLLKMGQDVQEMVSARADTLRHARLINEVKDPKLRRQLIKATSKEGASSREIQRRIEADSTGEVSARADTSPTASHNTTINAPISTQQGTGFDTTASDKPRQGPIQSCITPATNLLAEAARLTQETSLTYEYRRKMIGAIEKLEKQAAQLKAALQ